MRNLEWHDLQWALRLMPRPVLELMKRHGSDIVAAGGFVRAAVAQERPSDVDLFCPSAEKAEQYARELSEGAAERAIILNPAGVEIRRIENPRPGQMIPVDPQETLKIEKSRRYGSRVIKTDNAYTVAGRGRLSVQFIHRWTYPNPEQLLESFDFTIACGAFWWEPPRPDCSHVVLRPAVDGGSDVCLDCGAQFRADDPATSAGRWRSLVDDRFYPDLAAKRLVYRSPQRNEDAGGSLLRVLKFYQRGYRVPLDSMGAVIARLMSGVTEEGLNGLISEGRTREQAVARVVTGLLREVDPMIDAAHVAHLPAMEG